MANEAPTGANSRFRLPAWAWRAVDLGVVPTDSQETVRTKRLLTGALLISIPTSFVSAATTAFALGAPGAGAVILIAPIGNVVALALMRARPSAYEGVMHLVAAYNMGISLTIVALSGGLLASGINAVWGGALGVGCDGRLRRPTGDRLARDLPLRHGPRQPLGPEPRAAPFVLPQ